VLEVYRGTGLLKYPSSRCRKEKSADLSGNACGHLDALHRASFIKLICPKMTKIFICELLDYACSVCRILKQTKYRKQSRILDSKSSLNGITEYIFYSVAAGIVVREYFAEDGYNRLGN